MIPILHFLAELFYLFCLVSINAYWLKTWKVYRGVVQKISITIVLVLKLAGRVKNLSKLKSLWQLLQELNVVVDVKQFVLSFKEVRLACRLQELDDPAIRLMVIYANSLPLVRTKMSCLRVHALIPGKQTGKDHDQHMVKSHSEKLKEPLVFLFCWNVSNLCRVNDLKWGKGEWKTE